MQKNKVPIFDPNLIKTSGSIYAAVISISSGIIAFLPNLRFSIYFTLISFISVFLFIYIFLRCKYTRMNHINLKFEKSKIAISQGNIMSDEIYNDKDKIKIISFNEYFDVQVNNNGKNGLISETSLNGQFIKNKVTSIEKLNKRIRLDKEINTDDYVKDRKVKRPNGGKQRKYKLGTTFKYSNDVFLTALSHFDDDDKAYISIQEYVQFLFTFWNEIDKKYDGKTVVIPLFASGITRLDNGRIIDTQNIQIILWTFWMSNIKFTGSSKLLILLDKNTNYNVDYYKIKEWYNALQK